MSDVDTTADDVAEPEAEDVADVAEGDGAEEAAAEPSEDIIRIAKSLGWKEDKGKVDPSKWVGPEQFIANTRDIIFKQRDSLTKAESKLARMSRMAEDVQRKLRETRSADRDRLLAEADSDDAEIRRPALAKLATVDFSTPSGEDPSVTDFAERNASWFGVDGEATAYVQALDNRFTAEAGGLDRIEPAAHMKRIETAVKKRFPELFEDAEPEDAPRRRTLADQRRSTPLAASSTRAPARPQGTITAASLTPAERNAALQMGVKPEDYARNLQKLRDEEKSSVRA